MDWYAAGTILAILCAPIVALRVSVYLDEGKEAGKRKLDIFRDLMATRGTGLSPKHVEALNKIDIEFYDVDNVKDAWKEYKDHLDQAQKIDANNKEGWETWGSDREKLLTELLNKMANHLNYKFDNVQIKRGHYYPQAFINIETEQQIIRKGLVETFVDKKPIPVFAFVTDASQIDNQTTQEEIESKND